MEQQMDAQVIRLERGVTKTGKPMWKARTTDGEVFYLFDGDLPILTRAGYEVQQMAEGDVQTWRTHPIKVDLARNGEWWKMRRIEPRPADGAPDAPFTPDPLLFRLRAAKWAGLALTAREPILFDCETTGLELDDEIVSLATAYPSGHTVFKTLVRPEHPERLTGKVLELTGITPEMVAEAPTWRDLYPEAYRLLHSSTWIAYNVAFDAGMVAMACARIGEPPPAPQALIDAAVIASEFWGQWDTQRQRWQIPKLGEIAEHLGIQVTDAHDAQADTQTMLRVLQRINIWKPS